MVERCLTFLLVLATTTTGAAAAAAATTATTPATTEPTAEPTFATGLSCVSHCCKRRDVRQDTSPNMPKETIAQ
jgi:hypothetical protein